MDSLTLSSGSNGGAKEQAVVQSNGTETNRLEVNNNSDEGNESGAPNPTKKLGNMSSTIDSSEDGAGLPKVPVFKEPKATGAPFSMPPPSMPPPSMPPPSMPPPSMPPPSMPPPSMPPPSMPPPSMPPPSMPPPSMPPPSMPPPKISKSNLPGPMGPPPMRAKQSKEEVKEPVQSSAAEASTKSSSEDVKPLGGEGNDAVTTAVQASKSMVALDPASFGVPYVKPSWSSPPGHPFKLEVLKEGVIVSNFDVSSKGAYMFGRSDRCDFMLEHPTVSRYHAVLQYNDKGEAFIYDLGSTHGTFVNKRQVKAKVYAPVHVGAVVRFGISTRLYVLQGPSELMPKEGPSLKDRLVSGGAVGGAEDARMREMSLRRAKAEAAALDGASWGMQEDAEIEEEEEDLDEVTWQTYKGSLTEKQQKTLEKVQKRHEKLANLNKEIDAIRAKEGSQGGLTQGQQTQIARNEQRIEALLEELESLEETLNESIRESLGARTGKSISKKKPVFEDEEDEDDSDDEFYDRTNKPKQKAKKGEAVQVVETAETLLEKRDVLAKEMDVVLAELQAEEAKSSSAKEESSVTLESTIDPLDAFMSSVSTNIVKDKAARLSKELSKLQAEADRIARLLKIADPSGDAARKWDAQGSFSSQSQKVETILETWLRLRASKEIARELASSQAKEAPEVISAPPTADVNMDPIKIETKEMPVLAPTLLLGAPRPAPRPEAEKSEATKSSVAIEQATETGDEFVGYKERKRPASKEEDVNTEREGVVTSDIKLGSEDRDVASNAAMEAVALLMRHTSGLAAQEEAQQQENPKPAGTRTRGKKKRKLGPERPPTLAKEADELEEAWVPPQGQTGDGRTALNDKLGY